MSILNPKVTYKIDGKEIEIPEGQCANFTDKCTNPAVIQGLCEPCMDRKAEHAAGNQARHYGAVVAETISFIYMADEKKFVEVFGDVSGPALWQKFYYEKKKNEGDFFSYLDLGNRTKLMKAVLWKIQTGK